jgi:hypothetical protein
MSLAQRLSRLYTVLGLPELSEPSKQPNSDGEGIKPSGRSRAWALFDPLIIGGL